METLDLFVFFTVLVGVSASCPNGWTRHNSVCYHFSHDLEDWPGAKEICSILGGMLLEVDDTDESAFVSGEVKVLNKDFWLSLTDLVEEGLWQWMGSKNPLDPGPASNWASGQPDNWQGNENCAFIHNTDGRWIDTTCNSQRNYICEMDDTENIVIG